MVSEILDNRDQIVGVLVEKTGLSQEEVEDKIKKKQSEYGGLLTQAGAAYSIAKEYEVDLGLGEETKITGIKDLTDGLSGVTVQGVVTRVYPVKEWEKDGRKGKVGSISIKDRTGEIRVSFWNDKCELLEELKKGAQVEVRNVSARKRGDFLNLNFGSNSELVTKKIKDLPSVQEEIIKLSQLEEEMDNVNCFARAIRVFPVTHFERGDGSSGRVANVIITDGTETRLSLWDDNAKWAKKLEPGDVIKIEGGYVRENRDRLELNLGWKGRLIRSPEDAPDLPSVQLSSPERVLIKDLQPGDGRKELRAVIVQAYPPTLFEVCPSCGKKADNKCPDCDEETVHTLIFNCELDDGTGVIRGVFFRQRAEELLGITGEKFKEDSEAYQPSQILGAEKIFQGRGRKNQMFDREEFIVNRTKEVEVEKEIKRLKNG